MSPSGLMIMTKMPINYLQFLVGITLVPGCIDEMPHNNAISLSGIEVKKLKRPNSKSQLKGFIYSVNDYTCLYA